LFYEQHTDATGQVLEKETIDLVYEQTRGQPWLVNAVAHEVIERMLDSDYSQPITPDLVNQAVQTIILRRDTHIDSLLERLKEERVRRVIEPMLSGADFWGRTSDDYQYVIDLGLIKKERGTTVPSNPIYAEVIARTLSAESQETFEQVAPQAIIPRYLKAGKMDMDYLMRDFQQFWRENSAIWINKYQYREAAPHLILQAFLQRVLNGGGQIIREMASDTGRADLCVIYEDEKYPIELKIRRGEKTLPQGIEQTMRYMDVFDCSEGWLVIFDQRPDIDWDDKIYLKKETINGKTVTIIGA
jgi:hypothetical protein